MLRDGPRLPAGKPVEYWHAAMNVSYRRPLTVLLVEEHALVRAGLSALIDATAGLALVAEASDVREAVALAQEHSPDTILVGASALSRAGATATSQLRAAQPHCCIFVVGGDSDGAAPDRDALGIGSGADSNYTVVRHLPLGAGMQEFCADVSELFGVRCEDCRLQTICPVARAVTALTRRERQVAVRVAAGLTTKQIASMLGLAIRTVNTYRESLSKKLGASSAAALTRYVIESGLRDVASAEGNEHRTGQLARVKTFAT